MNIHISSPHDVGKAIRLLRLQKQFTGAQLGAKARISQSKISKIETGVVKVSIKEAKILLNILDCPKTIRQQIFTVLQEGGISAMHKFEPIVNKPGSVLERERNANSICTFLFQPLPAVLQTSAYREAILRLWRLTPTVFSQKMKESLDRQDLLFDSKREFHFIIHEAALYTLPTRRTEQIFQLDRLIRLLTAKNIKIGIIPVEVGLIGIENSNFIIYDTKSVTIIFAGNELHATDASIVTEHQKIFGELEKRAHYDNDAIRLIDKAIQHFTP